MNKTKYKKLTEKKNVKIKKMGKKVKKIQGVPKKTNNINKKIIKNLSKPIVKKTTKNSAKIEKLNLENINKAKIKEVATKQLSNNSLKEYISKNVGSGANGILSLLVEEPNVDEKIADVLKLKLNETRRMLNLLNNYGLVKYNINKDSNGWLTFVWYMDYESLDLFSKKIYEITDTKIQILPQDCNDFFICKTCSKSRTMVVSFETAFDGKFKCVCGNQLTMIEREKAEELYKAVNK
ncbi:MAG: hypothetical protein QXD23_00150 [Candidatus Micrarchaeaceae archaeon]